MRIYFDMDGTLATWKDVSFEELNKKGYFETLKPMKNMVKAAELLDKEYNVLCLSSVLDNAYALKEKRSWLKKYLPKIKLLAVPYGESKSEYLKRKGLYSSDDILIDDYSKNLHEWHGKAIKCYNGINGTNGTWKGESVMSFDSKENILKKIKEVAEC